MGTCILPENAPDAGGVRAAANKRKMWFDRPRVPSRRNVSISRRPLRSTEALALWRLEASQLVASRGGPGRTPWRLPTQPLACRARRSPARATPRNSPRNPQARTERNPIPPLQGLTVRLIWTRGVCEGGHHVPLGPLPKQEVLGCSLAGSPERCPKRIAQELGMFVALWSVLQVTSLESSPEVPQESVQGRARPTCGSESGSEGRYDSISLTINYI